jgi:hypothetical protein
MATSVACTFFFDAAPVGETSLVALDACALCAKPLGRGADIFMYRGDTPFCSEVCRYEEMQLDAIRARQAASRRQQQLSQTTAECQREQQSRKAELISG